MDAVDLMRSVIDIATYQAALDLRLPFADGFRDVYVKFGGDNVDPTYVAPHYTDQIDDAIALGFEHVGHYYVPNADPSDADDVDTPIEQADYMVDRLHRWDARTGFIVLDNENLDGSIRFNDAQAAEFIERPKWRLSIPGRQLLVYMNLSDARAHPWPLLLATGCNFIIAAPSYAPGKFPDIPTIPRDRIVGHQYGTRTWGGVVTDVNVFDDDAFEYEGGDGMYNPWSAWRVTGTWEDHRTYSEGGTDVPLPYGTELRAPASGRLVNNGWMGSAGRRATLHLDAPVKRVRARSTTPMLGGYVEHTCDMVAIVFQHAKGYLGDAWYPQGALLGFSGASAVVDGVRLDWGAQVHLHVHGLCAHGARVDFLKFFGAATAGTDYTPIEEDMMSALTDAEQRELLAKIKAIHTEVVTEEQRGLRILFDKTFEPNRQWLINDNTGKRYHIQSGSQVSLIERYLDTGKPAMLLAEYDQFVRPALAAVGAIDSVDEAKLAAALGPQLVAALASSGAATAEALEAVRVEVLTAIAGVDEATLATFGLKRA